MQLYLHDPSPETAAKTSALLASAGFDPVSLSDASLRDGAYLLTAAGTADLAVLLAGEADPMTAVRALRKAGHSNPVLVLARTRPDQVAALLDAGADDVVALPLQPVELRARINAILRRRHGHAAEALEMGDLTAWLNGRDPEVAGRPVPLTRREAQVFQVLARHWGRLVTKDLLYNTLYGFCEDPPLAKVIDVHVCTLRRKLAEASPTGACPIQSVARRGYRLG